jgi:uncharacterized protein YlzI (FlbEa/FlbD family)
MMNGKYHIVHEGKEEIVTRVIQYNRDIRRTQIGVG